MTIKELKEQLNKFDDNLPVKIKNINGMHDNIVKAEFKVVEEQLKYPQMFIDSRKMEFVSLEVEQ